MAVFDLGPPDSARPTEEYEFATYLMSRLRATDHAGCMDSRKVGVVLWDTDYAGAEIFTNSVLAGCTLPKAPKSE